MSKSISEIRQMFLDFFNSKGHQVVASSSLVPDNDSTLLFANAGMNQFKNVFLGLDNRFYNRATTSQRCVRVGGKHNDLENVGYTARHHTFFEMLGNFSFGDYFKDEAIQFAWELLTDKQWFNLPQEKLLVTVYANDDEAYTIWASIGVPAYRIIRIGDNQGSTYASDNFWQMGNTGPCGPCSEIFYDHGEHIWGGPPGSPQSHGDRYIEIWNLVFMQFNRQADGQLIPLPKPSVDTGMGLERMAAVLQNVHSNYDIDLFKKLIAAAARVTGASDHNSTSLRVIADHIRSCSFLVSDGVLPANEGRNYVLRRILRRAMYHGHRLGTRDTFFYKLVAPLIEVMDDAASQLKLQQAMVEQVLRAEEEKFARTLERGLIMLDEELAKLTSATLDGNTAFRLYDTYGLPLHEIADICRERTVCVDETGFKRAMEVQRKRARESSCFGINYNNRLLLCVDATTNFFGYETLEHQGRVTALFHEGQPVTVIHHGQQAVIVLDETPFYGESGGQVGDRGELKGTAGVFEVVNTQKYGQVLSHLGQLSYGELTLGAQVTAQVDCVRRARICLNHSATHLLHAGLRQLLGEHVKQKGSLVNDQYLRFDFSHNEAMKPEQICRVEDIVNEQIRRNLIIQTSIMTLEKARDQGALAFFGATYGSQVRVLSMGDFSIELCGGTHTNRTGDIGLFRIISESGTAAGIRRIEAVTGERAMILLHQQSDLVNNIAQLVKGNCQTLLYKVQALQEHAHKLEKDLQQLKHQQVLQKSVSLTHQVRDIHGVKVMVSHLYNVEPQMLRPIVDILKNKLGSAIIVLATVAKGQISLIAGVTKDLTTRIKAGEIINHLTQQVGGKGGGRPELAQAGGGKDITLLPAALASIDAILAAQL